MNFTTMTPLRCYESNMSGIRRSVDKQATVHTLQHSFATHMLESGANTRVPQDLPGHADVKTTEIYTHVMRKDSS